MRSAVAFALIGASALLGSALALKLSPDDEAARQAALQWLRVVDSGNYMDATLLISEEVRGQQDWLSYLSAQRAPLGRVKNRQIVEVKHRSSVPGTAEIRNHDIMRFKTSFEHKPGALEEVVMT